MKIEKFIALVLKKFGTKNQAIIAMEEMSELQKELSKFIRGCGSRGHIAEEIADVQLMLWQIQTAFHISGEELESRIEWKIERTLRRLKT